MVYGDTEVKLKVVPAPPVDGPFSRIDVAKFNVTLPVFAFAVNPKIGFLQLIRFPVPALKVVTPVPGAFLTSIYAQLIPKLDVEKVPVRTEINDSYTVAGIAAPNVHVAVDAIDSLPTYTSAGASLPAKLTVWLPLGARKDTDPLNEVPSNEFVVSHVSPA
jgi:hypothetical protein